MAVYDQIKGEPSMILISVQDIIKGFGAHEVLKGVSFSLQKGEKMGLVGVKAAAKPRSCVLLPAKWKPMAA